MAGKSPYTDAPTALSPAIPATSPSSPTASDGVALSGSPVSTITSNLSNVPSRPLKSILKKPSRFPTFAEDTDGSYGSLSGSSLDDSGFRLDIDAILHPGEDVYKEGLNKEGSIDPNALQLRFPRSVHFSKKVRYKRLNEADESSKGTGQLTRSEKIQKAREANRASMANNDYDVDHVALDKAHFAACINGLRTISHSVYKPILLYRTLHANIPDIDVENIKSFVHVDNHLTQTKNHLMGFFPFLFTKKVQAILLDRVKDATSFGNGFDLVYEPCSVDAQEYIASLLRKELADGSGTIDDDVLYWAAGVLIKPLCRKAILDEV